MRTNERVRRSSKKQENKKPAQDVVYMPPKPFNRNRFLLHLATVAAVVVAILLGISLFFKVNPDKILVSGNYKYTEWDIAEASGLKGGAENQNPVIEALAKFFAIAERAMARRHVQLTEIDKQIFNNIFSIADNYK